MPVLTPDRGLVDRALQPVHDLTPTEPLAAQHVHDLLPGAGVPRTRKIDRQPAPAHRGASCSTMGYRCRGR